MTPLLVKLLQSNAGRGAGKIRAEDSADGAGSTIYVYDAIVSDAYWGGVAAMDFVKAVAAAAGPRLTIRINSPGGDVFAAQTMCQALREFAGEVVCMVDGYAASAASLLALAGASCVMAPGAFLMVHRSHTACYGNCSDMADMATLLEKVDGTIADVYAKKSGKDRASCMAWMDAETWFTAEEAVAAGMANAIAEAPGAEALAKWDLSAYQHAPQHIPPAKPGNGQEPPAGIARPGPADIEHRAAIAAAHTDHLARRLRLAKAD